MVLMAFVGELGAGKTLSLTYFAYLNYLRGVKVYSNYHLNFPYIPVTSIEDIEDMKEGFFAGDELWLWMDSRASGSKKNKAISSILLKSRKRGVQICYTTQSFGQIDNRIRNITDFIACPFMSPKEQWCKVLILSRATMNKVKWLKFKTAEIFPLYDTTEEIKPIEDKNDKPRRRKTKKK
ncbi:MAG: hypothetical protein AM326_08240 [Candidatus Thorarchaeota archaeon SMTZ-45]|nr:MAG: hypothetical protein AM326_08240 [Candidatus Thorarchaeota archaeon SMTZ-45]